MRRDVNRMRRVKIKERSSKVYRPFHQFAKGQLYRKWILLWGYKLQCFHSSCERTCIKISPARIALCIQYLQMEGIAVTSLEIYCLK